MPNPDQYAQALEDTPQPRRAPGAPRPHRNWLRIIGRTILLFVVIALVSTLLYAGYIVSIVAKISTNSWQTGPLSADTGGRTNVLVLGVGDPGHAGQNLSDTIMVVSLDEASHRIAQVSIPRDLRVNIPGYGSSKINAAHAYGGVRLAEQTVSNTLDTQVDYYVKTDFSGLKGVVDAVGGLDVDVKDRLTDTEYPCDDNQYKVCGLDIKPGLQHMDGARALQYVRCRKGTCGNDFGRAERQQEVIGLLKPKVLDVHLLLEPAKLKQLCAAIQKGVQTDLGLIQLAELANRWRTDSTNNPVNLVLSTAPNGYLRGDPAGTSDLLPIGGDFSAIAHKFKVLFTDGK
jgi:LCP family protein required for cell wall assembly